MFKLARKSYFDDFFDDFFNTPTKNNALLSTDILDHEDSYELKIDVPGFEKEEIKASLENGYLSISAARTSDNKEENGRYVRQERINNSVVRKFYVGENITEEDISAKLENGVLSINVPKKKEEVKTKKLIEIK